jgi:membrane-associated phospholipid phosphatase
MMLIAAALCVLAFSVLLTLAYYVGPAQWLDAAALHGFNSLYREGIDSLAIGLAHLCNPFPYAIVASAVIVVAIKTRGLRTGAAVTLLLGGANVSSQVLKPLLAHHRELYYTEWHLNNINDAAFPSGHATAAMALSLAVLIIVPRSYRPLAATLGALFTVSVSFSILILQWHFPSDVVGGYLIATGWGLTAFAALLYANEKWPERGTMRSKARTAMPAPSPASIARVTILVAAVVAIAAASRAHQVASFADRHTAVVAVGSAIAVAAAVLLAAVAAISSSRSSRDPR